MSLYVSIRNVRRSIKIPRHPRKQHEAAVDPVGIQLIMELSESDFKITVLNILKEIQDEMEYFS